MTSSAANRQPGQVPLQIKRVRIAGGDRGTAQTVAYMTAAVMSGEGIFHPEVIRTATQIVSKVPSRDQQGEITAVLQWVKQNIAFRGEYGERVQTPFVTLSLRAGDCDCQSVLTAALLIVLGYKVRFRTVAADPRNPRAFSHVYAEILRRSTNQWISLDTSVAQSYPGWAPQKLFRSKAYHPMGDGPDFSQFTYSGPGADSGSSSTSPTAVQIISQIASPIAQGLAARIGGGRPIPNTHNTVGISGSVSAGGISPTALYVGGGLALGAIVLIAMRPSRSE